MNNRVLITTVDINCKCKLNAIGDNVFSKSINRKGTHLYDSLELSFNTVDETNILNINNIDVMSSISSKASASNVYNKEELNKFDIAFAAGLNNKADQANTY